MTASLRIVAARAILPATAHVAPPEIPAVWLLSAPVWEPSATKGVIEDGVRHQASLAELIGLCGCLVRIEINPAAVRLLKHGRSGRYFAFPRSCMTA